MKVAELIEILESLDSDLEVHLSYNYGDYWRTEVAPALEEIDITKVVYSDYHNMDRTIDDDSDEDEVRRVVVLR